MSDPLTRAALDTERHVARRGWDQPVRLFALVETAELLAREPALAAQLATEEQAPGELTAVEQEGMPPTADLASMLARVAWPETVVGAAIAVERIVVPPEAERDLPADPRAAVDALAAHPDRKDVRLLVAVLRGPEGRTAEGPAVCLLRQRDHDRDDRVATGADLAPGLVAALRATLEG